MPLAPAAEPEVAFLVDNLHDETCHFHSVSRWLEDKSEFLSLLDFRIYQLFVVLNWAV